MSAAEIEPGIYTHYKGNRYQVYEVAIHSETDEAYVVYRPLYGNRKLYIRPLEMFKESVTLSDGKAVPRFALTESNPETL